MVRCAQTHTFFASVVTLLATRDGPQLPVVQQPFSQEEATRLKAEASSPGTRLAMDFPRSPTEEAMNDWKKLGWVAVASVAVFALAGCERADAQSGKANVRPAAVAVASSDARPTADADRDNGPGCAESTLHASRK
jgi:hypothetical protein